MIHEIDTTKTWQVLYNFGWLPGTLVNIPATNKGPGTTFYNVQVTVQSVTTTIVNTDTLPVLHFQDYDFRDVIMNIGCASNFFIPVVASIIEGGPPYLRCYTDTVIGSYKTQGVVACDSAAGVAVIASATETQLYPNPATDIIHIQTPNNTAVLSAIVTSPDGRMIKTIPLPNQSISLTGLLNGMYLVMLHLQDGSTVTQKLLVQQ